MNIKVDFKNVDFDGYRSQRVKSLFNAEKNGFEKEFFLPIEDEEWSIGLVVGSSGSGKTSIGKQFFENIKIEDLYAGWDSDRPIVECILPNGDFNVVTGALASVGLGDVPSWLRPFKSLSNGQQFRAGLARVMAESPSEVVIDEFTSVVDRQIAKIGAMAFGKSWRRNKGKRAVLLSCHHDVIEWLQPDWVFNTDTGEFKKKTIYLNGQKSKLISGKLMEPTGSYLKSITI